MKVKHEKTEAAVIYSLEGEVNINTSLELRKAFDTIIKNDEKKVLVDFSGVSYIDSSGLATLIEMFQRLKNNEGRLRFCSMNQRVKSIFEITKLYKLFEIFDSREEALKDF